LQERKLEKSIVALKTSPLDRVFRKIKKAVNMPEYEELRVFQSVLWPHIFRWIFLTYSLLYIGVFSWMVASEIGSPMSLYNSEGSFILYEKKIGNFAHVGQT
jgi:hypothetical protein